MSVEVEISLQRYFNPSRCLCGSNAVEILKVSGMYSCRCRNCSRESEPGFTNTVAVLNWNRRKYEK